MAGKKGRSGLTKRTIYSRVHRISLTPADRDLLVFFQRLDQLPAGRRNAALLAAIRGGQNAVQVALHAPLESKRASQAIDAFLDDD